MKSNLAIRYKLVDVYIFNNSYLIYILYLVILNVFQLEYITKAASFKLINYLSIYLSIYLILRYFYTYFYERRIISSLIVLYYILWPYGARELKVKFENAHF